MDKIICADLKSCNKFHRGYCGTCKDRKDCIDLHEYEQGHNDELRDMAKEGEDE